MVGTFRSSRHRPAAAAGDHSLTGQRHRCDGSGFPRPELEELDIQDASDLFRQDVIDAQSRRLHGEVILRQSLSTRVVTLGIVIVALAAATWVVLGRYSRVETVQGMLIPTGGYAKITALRPGVLVTLRANDGDLVRAGQQLAVIKVETPNAAGAVGSREDLGSIANQSVLATQQVLLAGQRSQSESERLTGVIDGLHSQSATLGHQIDLQQQIVLSMTKTFEQVAPVVERGFISKIEYERRRQSMLSAREDLSRLQQQSAATKAEIAKTETERHQALLTGQNEQANARSALEVLRQQRIKAEGESSYSIEAPVAGRVTTMQTGVGRTVEPSVPLMVIVPEQAPLRADLFVPSRAIGFVKRGQEVRLLYDSFPYQRFGSYVAHVETISRLAIAGQETGAPFEIKDPVYRVTATLDRQQIESRGERVMLQPGMTLVADIILDRQTFLDWMLDPLRSVYKRN